LALVHLAALHDEGDPLDAGALDPEVTYLNHGTVGAPPKRVLQQQARRGETEHQPSRFVLHELDGHQPMPCGGG